MTTFTEYEDALANALGNAPQGDIEYDVSIAKLKLFYFVKIAQHRGYLSGLNYRQRKKFSSTLDELVREMRRRGATGFTETRMVSFVNATTLDTFNLSNGYVRNLILSLKHTSEYKENGQLRKLWRDVFGVEDGYLPHLLSRLSRTENNNLPEEDTTDFLYDYLLFRPDYNGLISKAFFRFYTHETGHIRTLGLRLDNAHHYLSSKGWLIKQEHGSLATGYIIDRSSSSGGILINGGVSSIFFNTSSTNPISRRDVRTKKMMMVSCFHFQAAYEREPTAACGVVVRLKGLEASGGLFAHNKYRRNKKTRRLQNTLSKRFGDPMDSDHCCDYLSNISGLSRMHFERLFMVNQEYFPSESIAAPFKLNFYDEKSDSDNPKSDIFIDGTKPLC